MIVAILCLSLTAWAQGYDGLIQQAQAKLLTGEYQEALELYAQAFQTGESYYGDYYNAACAANLAGHPDTAFTYLDAAIRDGLIEKEWLENDPDLESLKSEPRWERLLAALDSRVDDLMASFPEAHAQEMVLDLPEPRLASSASVEEALQNRRSIRSYDDAPLTLEEISQILWSAYGITQPRNDGPAFLRGGLRTAPSAGALYPLELYVVARNVTGLRPGVYWYRSETHQLVTIWDEDRWEELSQAGLGQPHFQTAAAAVVYSAVFQRTTEKYGQRGRERYVCMDLGHSAQNIYLQAYALGIGTCAIGAFGDLALKRAVGMTKEEEPLYIMPLGRVK
jgi:SagB-type dehydrogenase family enzyme